MTAKAAERVDQDEQNGDTRRNEWRRPAGDDEYRTKENTAPDANHPAHQPDNCSNYKSRNERQASRFMFLEVETKANGGKEKGRADNPLVIVSGQMDGATDKSRRNRSHRKRPKGFPVEGAFSKKLDCAN